MRTDITANQKYDVELTPLDNSDFGGNDWFNCPECGNNLKLGWFMDTDQECNDCGTHLMAAVVTEEE